MSSQNSRFSLYFFVASLILFLSVLLLYFSNFIAKATVSFSKIFAGTKFQGQNPPPLVIQSIDRPLAGEKWDSDKPHQILWAFKPRLVNLLRQYNNRANSPHRYGPSTYFFNSATVLIGGIDLFYQGQRICAAIMNPFGGLNFSIPYKQDKLDMTSGTFPVQIFPVGERSRVVTGFWSTNSLGQLTKDLTKDKDNIGQELCQVAAGEQYIISVWTAQLDVLAPNFHSVIEDGSSILFNPSRKWSGVFTIE